MCRDEIHCFVVDARVVHPHVCPLLLVVARFEEVGVRRSENQPLHTHQQLHQTMLVIYLSSFLFFPYPPTLRCLSLSLSLSPPPSHALFLPLYTCKIFDDCGCHISTLRPDQVPNKLTVIQEKRKEKEKLDEDLTVYIIERE